MKATLTADGTLTITPETPVEAYALGHWLRAGRRGKHGLIEIAALAEATGYEFKPGQVIPWPSAGTGEYYPTPFYTISGTGNGSPQFVGSTTSASAGTCP